MIMKRIVWVWRNTCAWFGIPEDAEGPRRTANGIACLVRPDDDVVWFGFRSAEDWHRAEDWSAH